MNGTGFTIKVSADTASVGRELRGVERSVGGLGDRLNRSLDGFDPAKKLRDSSGRFKTAGERAGTSFAKGFLANIQQGIGQGVGQTLAGLPLAAGAAAFDGLSSAVGGSVAVFRDFDSAMVQVGVITQGSKEDIAALREETKRLGANTSKGAVEIAQLNVALSRAGFSANEQTVALEGIVRASEATGASLSGIGDIGAKVVRSFTNIGLSAGSAGLRAQDMQAVMDALTATSSNANTDITQVGFAMRFLGPQANASKQPLNDMAVLLGLLADAGLQGEMGGNAASEAIKRLSLLSAGGGTDAAQAAWEGLGIKARDANGEMRPFLTLLPELRAKLGGLAPDQRDVIVDTLFGDTGGRAIQTVIGATQQSIDELTDNVQNAAGISVQSGEQMQQGLGGALAQLSSALEGLALQFGGAIAPAIEGFAKLISSFLSQFNESGAFDALQEGFEKVQATLEAIASDEELMTGVADAIAEVVKALGGLTADGLEAIANFLADNADQIPAAAEGFKDFVLQAVEMGQQAGEVIEPLGQLLGLLFELLGTLSGVQAAFAAPIFDAFLEKLGTGIEAISNAVDRVTGLASQILGIEQALNAGGAASGVSEAFGKAAEEIRQFQEKATKESTELAAKGEDDKLKNLKSANAKAKAELTKSAEDEEEIEKQKQANLKALRERQGVREAEAAQQSTATETDIRQRQLSGAIDDEQADALISQKAVDDSKLAIAAIEAGIEDLNRAREEGLIDEKQYAEESRKLQEDLAQSNLDLIDDQLAEKRRANEAALQLIRDEQAAREATAAAESTTEAIGIRQQELSGAITGEEADALISRKSVDDAKVRIELVRSEIAGLQQAKAQGLIEDEEANNRLRQLDQDLLNAKLGALNAELAAKQQAQQEAVRLIEAEGQVAKTALDDRVLAIDAVTEGLKQQQGLLGAQSDLQGALADQENARFESALAAAKSDAERQKIQEQQAAAKVEQLLAAQEIEQQQLELSQAQADADLARQSVLAEIAQLEAEIALEKLKAAGASEQEIAAQTRILGLRKKQVADLGKAAQVQDSIQDLQTQTLGVRQQTARQRLGTELKAPSVAPQSSSSNFAPSDRSSRSSSSSGSFRPRRGLSDAENQRLANGDRVRGLRIITSESVARSKESTGQATAGISAALSKLEQGANPQLADLGKTFSTVQATETGRVVEELKALREAVNSQSPVPNSLTVTTPDPVNDSAKIMLDLQRGAVR